MKRHFIGYLMLMLVTAVTANAQTAAGGPDLSGELSDRVYKNKYFGLTLEVPKGWIISDRETQEATKAVGTEVVKSTDERKNKALQDSFKRETMLLQATKLPIGAMDNAMFVIVANRQMSPAITASMVAEATKSAFSASPALKLLNDTRVETIAGRKFARLDYGININGEQKGKILFYATMHKNYALTFSLSYSDESDLATLQQIVGSFKFQ